MVLLRNSSANSAAIKHLNSVTHEGKVVTFATDTNGKIWYTVKQDGFEDSYLNTPEKDRTGWENWKELQFPNEADDQSVVNQEKSELTYENNNSNYVIRSRYKTGEQSAIAPVQAISTLDHIYVFRQSKSNTLLVDRFVLDAMTNRLNRKYEVRFKRSKQKYTPSKNMTKGSGGLSNVDTLDFRDTSNNFFYEPTTELCMVNNLQNGWFCVVCVPTIENDIYRWHIFSYNSQSQKIELTTLRASEEGLFAVKDYSFFEENQESLELRKIPGIIKRSLDIPGVRITNGLSATKYDIQQEQETQSGEKQLLRMTTRLMLVIATDKGAVSLSFGIAKDGLLAEAESRNTSNNSQNTVRAQLRELLLPLTVLDEIKPLSDRTPPPKGIITGLAQGTDEEDAEDLVKITNDKNIVGLDDGDLVKIGGNDDYQGFYRTKIVDKNNFEVTLPTKLENLGYWDKQEEEAEERGLRFDGMISAYKITPQGKLLITCENHGVQDGDEVHIINTDSYNQTYPVRKIDDTNFVIEKQWPAGEVLDLRVLSVKRRGVVFDGVDDYIELPEMNYPFAKGISLEAWVWYDSLKSSARIIDFSNGSTEDSIVLASADSSNSLSLTVYVGNISRTITAAGVLETGKWLHLAATIDALGNAKLYKNGVAVQSGTMTAPDNVKRSKNYIARSSTANDGYFPGKIADLRLWKVARTGDEIKDSMYLQLTGQETFLVGYWRLSGIAEKTVPDFGVYVNDGRVYGDPYVSATLLRRTLKDGSEAVRYSNPELVAVSQRTTYEESFEFKVNSSSAINLAYLNNADGRNNKIFTFSYWGKASRSAEGRIFIKIGENAQTFQDLGQGWYRATCRVTIPEGVGMLRCFELANVKGNWTSLEIRKHRILSVSNSITETNYLQSLRDLKTLADNQTTLAAKLKQIAPKEQQLITLGKERRDLLDKIKLLEMPKDVAIAEKDKEIKAQEKNVASAQNDTKYWNTEKTYSEQLAGFTGQYMARQSYGLGKHSFKTKQDRINATSAVRSVKVEPGLKAIVRFGQEDNIPNHPDGYYELTITQDDSGTSKSYTPFGFLYPLTLSDLFMQHFVSGSHNIVTSIEIQTKNGNKDVVEIQTNWSAAQTEQSRQETLLKELQSESDTLKASEVTRNEELRKCKDRLNQVNPLISQLKAELNTLNAEFIQAVQKTQTTPQTLPKISEDARRLVSNGAILGFVQASSRINALETCEGNVQLSYFDNEGRMRQTNFDATADSRNPAFEQWIPDTFRTCLNFAGKDSTVKLTTPFLLGENWTVEAWFTYPLPETPSWNTLVKGKTHSPIIVKEGKQLGFYHDSGLLGQKFYPIDYDMQSLSGGWHHLAVVAKEDTQVFYIDGKKVGDTKSKAIADAEAAQKKTPNDANAGKLVNDLKKAKIKVSDEVINFGGFLAANGDPQPFGQIAEVRFWGVALNDDEVAINSQTLLSGNEPGLLAYYPLNEGTGNIVRNQTGFINDGQVSKLVELSGGSSATPAPRNKVMKFDPTKQSTIKTELKNLGGDEITIEYWFKGTSLQSAVRQQAGDNYVVSGWRGQHLFSNDGGITAGIKVGDSATDGNWHHVAMTWKRNTDNGFVSYLDGVLIAQRRSANVSIPSLNANVFIGSFLGQSEFTDGQLTEVRIWNKARTQAEIQATMNKRLSGKEANLIAYYPLDEIKVETTPQQASDLVAQNNGTVVEATSIDDTSLPITPVGQSINFDGVNDSISVPDNANLQITSYTVEIWIKPKTPNQEWSGIIGKPGRAFHIWLNHNGYIHHRFHTASSWTDGIADTPNGLIKWDQWNHLAITNDGRTARTYINGNIQSEGSVTSSLVADQTTLCIGCSLDSYRRDSFFKGQMSEARIWKVARTQAEILADMNKRLTGREANLVAYYPLNKLQPLQRVLDLVGTNHGTVVEVSSVEDNILPIASSDTSPTIASIPSSVNRAIKFDGVRNFIDTEFRALAGDQITIEYWFKGESLQSAVRQQDNQPYWNHYVIAGWNGLHCLSNDGGHNRGIKVGNATDGQWHHVAMTWKQNTTNGFVSYLDGKLIEQRSSSNEAIPSINSNVFIGSYIGQEQFTKGALTEVRIWKVARTQAEIQSTMNKRLSGKEANLIAYYPLNEIKAEGTNQKVIDLVTNKDSRFNGGNGSTVLADNILAGEPSTHWLPCSAPIGAPVKKIMRFDGVNDHLQLPDINDNFSGGFTVEAWVWYDNLNSYSRIIDLGNGSSADNIILCNNETSGKLHLAIYNGSTAQHCITANAVLEIKQWIHLVATIDSSGNAKLYKNGLEVQAGGVFLPNNNKRTKNYIGRSNMINDGYFQGKMSEVRLWNKARTQAEIQADMYKRLTGKEANLVAYYPLDQILVEGSNQRVPNLVNNNYAQVIEACLIDSNSLPIAYDALISSEYSTITVDPINQSKVALMRRFLAYPADGGVELLSGKRIEALELRWIGNAQYAPTLLGYIEGPPPVPSENLTVQDDYNGATSVELAMSEDVSYSWNRSQEAGLGANLEAGVGGGGSTSILTAPMGVGTAIDIEMSAKAKMNFDFNYQFTNQTNITSSSSLSVTDKLELRGTPEQTPHFSHLGNRFIPKNVGYALVISALADVFITRLARSGKMIGYQVQPVEGIPPDVNTITFLINPAYTMNGSLDGLTGSEPTSNRFFRQVSQMRAQYGSLYPASYYRLKEAYNLKQAIENEDKRREAYFANFDVRTLDETSLDRNIDSGAAPGTIGLQREEDKPDATANDKANAQNTQVEQANKQAQDSADQSSQEAKKKQAEIQSKIGDREKQAHATEAFAGWQRRMEALQIKAGKRNIVNTYVWDADGGLRTEQQSFANTVEHSIGGSFSMNAGLGFDFEVEAFGIAVDLSAQATVSLTQTMTKTLASSKGFQLNVDLSGVEYRGITNYKDLPVMPGQKVDRYRFMSFYLEGSTDNFADFFNYVVDPEWLASNDEEARALRQTQAGKPNKAWRILHRVTYVERPALMGFGRDTRPVQSDLIDKATSEVVNYFEDLDAKQRLLEAKIDEILALLKRK